MTSIPGPGLQAARPILCLQAGNMAAPQPSPRLAGQVPRPLIFLLTKGTVTCKQCGGHGADIAPTAISGLPLFRPVCFRAVIVCSEDRERGVLAVFSLFFFIVSFGELYFDISWCKVFSVGHRWGVCMCAGVRCLHTPKFRTSSHFSHLTGLVK